MDLYRCSYLIKLYNRYEQSVRDVQSNALGLISARINIKLTIIRYMSLEKRVSHKRKQDLVR